jgi:hypothetical protein
MSGGYKNSTEMLLTGLDIEAKAEILTDALFASLGGKEAFDDVEIQLIRTDHLDPRSNEEAQASLRISVRSDDPQKVGRLFSAKVVELALSNYPGFTGRGMTGSGGPVIAYWPTLVDSRFLREHVHVDGQEIEVVPTSQLELEEIYYQQTPYMPVPIPDGAATEIPFGRLFGTRSGDKGGCANLGVWAKTDAAYAWLHANLTVDKFKSLLADTAPYEIDRYELPNLRALNFYIHGILGDGVSSNNRLDGQAKSLGEYLRAKTIEVPAELAAEAVMRSVT